MAAEMAVIPAQGWCILSFEGDIDSVGMSHESDPEIGRDGHTLEIDRPWLGRRR